MVEFWSGRLYVWNSGKEFYGFLDYMFMNLDWDIDLQWFVSGFFLWVGFIGIDYLVECLIGGWVDGVWNYVIFSEVDLKIIVYECFCFIGEKGVFRFDWFEGVFLWLENFVVVCEMEKFGKDVGIIKVVIGWECGVDSKWCYEMVDFEYYLVGDLGYL